MRVEGHGSPGFHVEAVDPAVEAGYRVSIEKHQPDAPPVHRIERFAFYDRAKTAFAIVMTDGYYNGSDPSINNVDGDNGAPYADTYDDTLADVEKQIIIGMLQDTSGVQSKAAKLLGISERSRQRAFGTWETPSAVSPGP